MYYFEHDPNQSLAIWYFHKPVAADWTLHFEHLRALTRYSATTGKRCAALMITRSFDMPDADQRTTLTQITGSPGYDPLVAFVAPNTMLKTLLNLFSWFQKKPAYTMEFVDSISSGLAWLEAQRGTPLPRLREMASLVLKRAGDLEVISGPNARLG